MFEEQKTSSDPITETLFHKVMILFNQTGKLAWLGSGDSCPYLDVTLCGDLHYYSVPSGGLLYCWEVPACFFTWVIFCSYPCFLAGGFPLVPGRDNFSH